MFNEPITTTGKHAYGHLAEFPFFFGTVLFALEAIGVVCFLFYITQYLILSIFDLTITKQFSFPFR